TDQSNEYVCLFFFFQAEDGIRDRNVTGVQTCALPISLSSLLRVCSINSSKAHCTAKLISHSLRFNCDSSSRSNASIVAAVTLCWATKSAEIDFPIERPSIIALAEFSILIVYSPPIDSAAFVAVSGA